MKDGRNSEIELPEDSMEMIDQTEIAKYEANLSFDERMIYRRNKLSSECKKLMSKGPKANILKGRRLSALRLTSQPKILQTRSQIKKKISLLSSL